MTRRFSSGGRWEQAVGYSRAVAAGDYVFVSGCTSVQGTELVHEGDARMRRGFQVEFGQLARPVGLQDQGIGVGARAPGHRQIDIAGVRIDRDVRHADLV